MKHVSSNSTAPATRGLRCRKETSYVRRRRTAYRGLIRRVLPLGDYRAGHTVTSQTNGPDPDFHHFTGHLPRPSGYEPEFDYGRRTCVPG